MGKGAKNGDKHWNPSPKRDEPLNHDGTQAPSEEKKGEERRQAPEPQPERAEPVNHDETETLSRKKKKREETRQVTEPRQHEEEPGIP